MEEKKISISVVVSVAILCLLIGIAITYFGFPREVIMPGEVCEDVDTGETCEPIKDCEICKPIEEQEEENKISEGYLLDNLFLESAFVDTLSDREIFLFDDEIDFDGDDYDAEETFSIDGIILKANEYDFDGNTYLTIPANSISYEFIIEPGFNASLIGNEDENNEDETLEISLLGQDIVISEWDIVNNEITLIQGTKYVMEEDETLTIDGKEVTLLYVLDDNVYISVDDEERSIRDGYTRTINGLEIKVDEAFDYGSRTDKVSRAILIIGEEIEKTISHEDEYSDEDDNIWEWVITSNSIGLVLIEDFVEIDEDFNALAPEEIICLPNKYVCIKYNGLLGQDTEEYKFDLKNGFVRIKGNFLYGIKEYDEIYVNTTGIFDDDNDGVLIGTEISIADTDSILKIISDEIVIEDFRVNFDLNVTNVGDEEENFLTNFGILVENPEDSIENNEFTIVIPEEKAEGILTVKIFGFDIVEEEVVEEVIE